MHRVTLVADAEAYRQRQIAAHLPRVETLSVEEARTMLARLREAGASTCPALHARQDLSGHGVRMRLYRPCDGTLPVIVFCHGGGWVLRTLDDYDAFCSHLALVTGAAVISIDYRLAPEHRFPAAVDDTAQAIRWVSKSAESLNLDPERLVFAGDSAGGNLMAVAALMARDGTVPTPRLQVLLYPILDATLSHPSQAFKMEGLLLSGDLMRWFCDKYLEAGQERDWRASPLLADALEGVAPCVLMTVGADPLRDEGNAYADRLVREGCAVSHIHYPGLPHAFLTTDPAGPRAQSALRLVSALIAEHLS